MNDDRKLWVIEDNEEPVITNLGDDLQETPTPPAPRPATVRRSAPQTAPRRNQTRPAATRRPRLHSAILLALAWVLGPAALALTERGRRSGMWVGLAMVCAAATVVVAAGWLSFLRGEVPAALLPALVLAGTLIVATSASVWSRALHLLLTARRFPTRPWPDWLLNPWTALAAGIAAPGSAMALVRRPRLAALTAWWTWPGVAAVLLLVQAPLVWRHREAFGNWGLGPDTLEYILVVAAVLVAAAFAFWVGQALAGARLLAQRSGRWQGTRGDWTGIGLAAAALVFVIVVQPSVVARDLAVYASALADAECQVIPLGLNTVAQRMDPGEVAYALQGAELHAARGDLETAQVVREDLHRRLRPYLGLLASAPSPAPAVVDPAMPWTGDLPSPQVLPASGAGPVPPSTPPAEDSGLAGPAVRSAAAAARLFGPVLVPAAEAAVGQPAAADSLP